MKKATRKLDSAALSRERESSPMSNDPSKFEFDDAEDASNELDFEDLEQEAPDFPSDLTEDEFSDDMEDLAEAEPTDELGEGPPDEAGQNEETEGGELAEEAGDESGEETDDAAETEESEDKPRRWFSAMKWDLYTVMLGMSLIAVTIACLLLYLELQQYSPFPWWRTSGVVEGM